MHAWVNYIAYACRYNEESSINIRNHVPLIVLRKTYVESCFKIEPVFYGTPCRSHHEDSKYVDDPNYNSGKHQEFVTFIAENGNEVLRLHFENAARNTTYRSQKYSE